MNRECTTNFGTVDKQYQDVFLPNATENILILAKKLQQKHFKSKAVRKNIWDYSLRSFFLET